MVMLPHPRRLLLLQLLLLHRLLRSPPWFWQMGGLVVMLELVRNEEVADEVFV
jgi:hypothetical protein